MRISDWSSDVCSSDLNLPANDQPAKDIHHQVQTIELTTHCSGQECDIPPPHLARCGGGPGARPFGHMGRSRAATMLHWLMLMPHSAKVRVAVNIASLYRQPRHDRGRRPAARKGAASGPRVSVRGDLGGRLMINKKTVSATRGA